MQEAKITDPDSVTRRYAYDTWGGQLYITDPAASLMNPGRPYRPIYSAVKPDAFGIREAHAAMWTDPTAALKAIAAERPQIAWRSAH